MIKAKKNFHFFLSAIHRKGLKYRREYYVYSNSFLFIWNEGMCIIFVISAYIFCISFYPIIFQIYTLLLNGQRLKLFTRYNSNNIIICLMGAIADLIALE